MPRAGEEATRRLLGALQRALSCITPAVVIRRPPSDEEPQAFTFRERFARLQARPALELSFLHFYDVVSSRGAADAIQTTGYFYQLHERDGTEIIAFHWHPHRLSSPAFPHLHVLTQAGVARIERKHHVPTGFVSAPAVIRFAITELGVLPRRPEWEQVLHEAERIVGRATAE